MGVFVCVCVCVRVCACVCVYLIVFVFVCVCMCVWDLTFLYVRHYWIVCVLIGLWHTMLLCDIGDIYCSYVTHSFIHVAWHDVSRDMTHSCARLAYRCECIWNAYSNICIRIYINIYTQTHSSIRINMYIHVSRSSRVWTRHLFIHIYLFIRTHTQIYMKRCIYTCLVHTRDMTSTWLVDTPAGCAHELRGAISTRLIHTPSSHAHVTHSFNCVTHSFNCVTHSFNCVTHSFNCVASLGATRLIDMCDMTLQHTCNPHSHVCHDSFTCATRLIDMCDMTHS